MVRLVLFDVDGTLIRTGGAGVRAFARTLACTFACPDGTSSISFAGRTDTSLVREIFLRQQIEPSAANFVRFFDTYPFWLDHLLQDCQGGAIPGVLAFIGALRALPQPPLLGLLTGNVRLGAELKLRRFGLWDHFETGAFADDDEDRACIARIAVERGARLLGTRLAGSEVLVIGDTPHDVTCGRAVGARVLGVATGGATFEHLNTAAPDWTVCSLEDIAPDRICQ